MTHRHPNTTAQADFLDLEAEVLAEHTAAITAWLPVTTAPRHIVDLGSGTGAGTFALLERFARAEVIAVDAESEHLDRLHQKAQAVGAQDRLRVVPADLDAADWPDLGRPDLVWASASMHHMADPDHVLRKVFETLKPGGLFAVIELAGMPRFLPQSAPEDRPGLEERCHAAASTLHRHQHSMPHRGADWGPKLAAAGFAVEAERTIAVSVDAARSTAVSRYALSTFQRLRHTVADTLSAADLAALDRLLDTDSPHSIARRGDVAVRTERTVWAARRV